MVSWKGLEAFLVSVVRLCRIVTNVDRFLGAGALAPGEPDCVLAVPKAVKTTLLVRWFPIDWRPFSVAVIVLLHFRRLGR